MADTWIATTNIKYGEEDGSIRHIQEGMPVTGLDDETMEQLKEAGSVVREDVLYAAKRELPGGVSNSFDIAQLPDTPAGNRVRKALEELRDETAKKQMEEYKTQPEDFDPNVPPMRASEAGAGASAEGGGTAETSDGGETGGPKKSAAEAAKAANADKGSGADTGAKTEKK
jgi:hypothetical protein